jgi:hypothetical protein
LGSAYTPGLKVSSRTTIEKLRRLPLKGDVLVKEGDVVTPDTVVARTELPGIMQTIKLAEQMGVEASDVKNTLQVKVGDKIEKGMLLAQTKGLFGMFKAEYKAQVDGIFELYSEHTGHLGIRQPPTPIEKDAYIRGRVTKVMQGEGVIVECEGALVQGIFGVGGERQGVISVVASAPDEPLTDSMLNENQRGKIVVGGANVNLAALKKAAEVGAVGIVVGGVVDRELIDYLRGVLNDPSFDIGVAITGQEPIAFTLVVTEGFGSIPMANRTYSLLKSLDGKTASINGATQIRAGVIRPEVIVPTEVEHNHQRNVQHESGELAIGTSIRVIREPYFGILGNVTALPAELCKVESETMVRILETKLQDGRTVTVPRANVEIIEEA